VHYDGKSSMSADKLSFTFILPSGRAPLGVAFGVTGNATLLEDCDAQTVIDAHINPSSNIRPYCLMRILFCVSLIALCLAQAGLAQVAFSTSCADIYRGRLKEQVEQALTIKDPDQMPRQAIKNLDQMVRLEAPCFAAFASQILSTDRVNAARQGTILAKALESWRTDKQASTPATGTGTTIVSRGVTAKTIGIAADAGALTETAKGQTVTVSGTLAGFPSALVQKNLLTFCDDRFGANANHKGARFQVGSNCDVSNNVLRTLRKISYSVSFDTSQSSQTVTGSTSGQWGGLGRLDGFQPAATGFVSGESP
jgi:hypothetical protein